MKETYKNAIIEEAVRQLMECYDNKLNKEELTARVREYVEEQYAVSVEAGEEDEWGCFEDDVDFLFDEIHQQIEEEAQDQEPESTPAQTIEEIVNSLKIGYNYVPGIGVGFCSNEADLEAMKNFVRGGLTTMEVMGSLMGLFS